VTESIKSVSKNLMFNFSFNTGTSGGVGTMQSLFTNNAQVYYKPHSLAVGGTGTVVNSRHKARKT